MPSVRAFGLTVVLGIVGLSVVLVGNPSRRTT
jgi:hypothetical protein